MLIYLVVNMFALSLQKKLKNNSDNNANKAIFLHMYF